MLVSHLKLEHLFLDLLLLLGRLGLRLVHLPLFVVHVFGRHHARRQLGADAAGDLVGSGPILRLHDLVGGDRHRVRHGVDHRHHLLAGLDAARRVTRARGDAHRILAHGDVHAVGIFAIDRDLLLGHHVGAEDLDDPGRVEHEWDQLVDDTPHLFDGHVEVIGIGDAADLAYPLAGHDRLAADLVRLHPEARLMDVADVADVLARDARLLDQRPLHLHRVCAHGRCAGLGVVDEERIVGKMALAPQVLTPLHRRTRRHPLRLGRSDEFLRDGAAPVVVELLRIAQEPDQTPADAVALHENLPPRHPEHRHTLDGQVIRPRKDVERRAKVHLRVLTLNVADHRLTVRARSNRVPPGLHRKVGDVLHRAVEHEGHGALR